MKARTRFYIFLLLILVIGGIVCLLTLPAFHTRYIQIENTDRKNEYILNEIEKLTAGKSIFLADRIKIKTEIEKDPYLVYKTITYRLPDRVVIHVEERQPKYYLTHMNNYLYMTYDGIVINAQKEPLSDNIPVVKGLTVNSFAVRETLNISDSYQLGELTAIMDKFVPVGLEYRISEIDMTDIVNIKMKTNDGHEIIFGTSEKSERKIEWIFAILDNIANEEGKKFSVDVSAPENPTYKEIATKTEDL